MAKLDLAISTAQPATSKPLPQEDQPEAAVLVSLCIKVTPEQRREIKTYAASIGLSHKSLLMRSVEEYRERHGG